MNFFLVMSEITDMSDTVQLMFSLMGLAGVRYSSGINASERWLHAHNHVKQEDAGELV